MIKVSSFTKVLPWNDVRNCKENTGRDDVEAVKDSDCQHQIVKITFALLYRENHQRNNVPKESD